MPRNPFSIEKTISTHSEPIPGSGCILWTGSITKGGYGYFSQTKQGKKIKTYAHRAVYARRFGPIPARTCVCHRCDVPSCVNPDHLFLGTHSDNMADMVKKGRSHRSIGESNGGGGKLTEWDVVSIRMDTRPRHEIAAAFGVSGKTIWRVRSGFHWSHIPYL